MKKLLIATFSVLLACCASQEKEIELPSILNIEGKNYASLSGIADKEIVISKPVNDEFQAKVLKEPPPVALGCGGVYWVESDPGAELLKNADLVFELSGEREVWVPINGKPKKFYVFDVR